MTWLTPSAILFLTVLATGCASITRGTTDAFATQSTPSGATVSLSNGLTCVTPCAMELPRKHGFSVTFTLDGYKTLTTNVVPRQAGAGSAGMAGNIIFGGLIGAAVDAGSGAMKDLYPNPLVVTLVPLTSTKESVVELPAGEAEELGGATDTDESTTDETTDVSEDVTGDESSLTETPVDSASETSEDP